VHLYKCQKLVTIVKKYYEENSDSRLTLEYGSLVKSTLSKVKLSETFRDSKALKKKHFYVELFDEKILLFLTVV